MSLDCEPASASGLAVRHRVPMLPFERLRARRDAVVIDLRSPSEFAVDHVPGAYSVPLFDDDERALVGTLYARSSPDVAFVAARERARARITELVERIANLADWRVESGDHGARLERMTEDGIAMLDQSLEATEAAVPARPVVLYCWRGGLRSRSVLAFVRQLGLDRAVGIAGGYKSYRKSVLARLASWEAPPVIVLRGLTGVGKTLVLHEIERLRPGWTLDLEAAAGHRSSILGMVGLAPVTQKAFDTALAARLDELSGPCCVLEGESRKVGDVIQPATVWAALEAGTSVRLTASVERRVEVLCDDYLEREENRAELAERLPFIEARLGRAKWGGVLVGLLSRGQDDELTEILLRRYYDPLYQHSEAGRGAALEIDAADPRACAARIVRWVEDGSGVEEG